jgi:RimJ/RimL family protein N-acetyltransferase
MTGVRRAFRRRGIAGALKQAQLVAARRHGVQLLVAANDLRNAPMRRLNERLGYVRRPDTVTLTASLDDIPG